MTKPFIAAVAAALLATVASLAAADDKALNVGLSFVANSGNSDSTSLGLTGDYTSEFGEWGLKLSAVAIKAAANGDTTAERYAAAARGVRALSEEWDVFAGLSAERDRFAGYNLRGVGEAGVTLKYLRGGDHNLSFDAGLTWTREDPRSGGSYDYLGALLGATYLWKITESSSLGERFAFYPNFDESSDWRATSETILQASLSETTALKLSVLVRYDREPIPGFEKTDTTTMASVVIKL